MVEWGKKERKAFESMTGKPYEFGDLSKFVASSVCARGGGHEKADVQMNL